MKTLLLLAHADDESLGCGGFVQKLKAQGADIQLIVVSDGIVKMRESADDNRDSLHRACEILGIEDVICLDFPDQRFDEFTVAEICNRISKSMKPPELIITHSAHDLNRDHQIVSQAACIVGRPRGRAISILGCEIPCGVQWGGKPFSPQFYVDISQELETKIKAFESYSQELRVFPDPFSSEGLRTLAKFRGMESGHQAAEAFSVVRLDYPFAMGQEIERRPNG